MKTKTCVDVLSCSEGFSEHQTGDFSLPGKGLHRFLMMFCGLMNTPIYIEEKLYIASEHQNIIKLLFLLMNNSLRKPDNHQNISLFSLCCFLSTISVFIAYFRVVGHNGASFCGSEVRYG